MAARASWGGHLRLSLVACPVSLFPATSSTHEVRFHLINPDTGNRIQTKVFDTDGDEVERKNLVRGFEIEKDEYVLLTDEEIKSVRLESTHTIDIERFVDASEIDRIWWNDPYYLVPDGKAGVDAFVVIRVAMETAGKVALARVVMGTRERIVAIEPRGAAMLLTTLRTRDEVREMDEVAGHIPTQKADKGMIEIAERIIAQKEGPFDPSEFTDRYEEALRALIEAKRDGDGGGTRASPPRENNVIDLMEALRRSLEGSGSAAPKRVAARSKSASASAAKPAASGAGKSGKAKPPANGKAKQPSSGKSKTSAPAKAKPASAGTKRKRAAG